MTLHGIFDVQGSPIQQQWIIETIDRFTFKHWQRLLTKLAVEGRTNIPVMFSDLSRYSAMLAAKTEGEHLHFHEDGDTADPVEFRQQVLGLAWYSGRISIERSIGKELAQEVFAAEVAHMVDFFDPAMDGGGRELINLAYHGGTLTDHGHDQWFDEGGYYDWPGESFMEGFTRAFSDIVPTITGFTHRTTPAVVEVIRAVLDPQPKPEPPRFGGVNGSKVFHKLSCFMLRLAGGPDVTWPVREVTAPRRPCKVCRP